MLCYRLLIPSRLTGWPWRWRLITCCHRWEIRIASNPHTCTKRLLAITGIYRSRGHSLSFKRLPKANKLCAEDSKRLITCGSSLLSYRIHGNRNSWSKVEIRWNRYPQDRQDKCQISLSDLWLRSQKRSYTSSRFCIIFPYHLLSTDYSY